MSRIKGKDTKPEIAVRKYLFRKGFRFRKNDKRYPGKPDIVLPKYHTVIFIHGCFWHHHVGCKQATMPKTRTEFWEKKFAQNADNDTRHKQQLEEMGFRVITIWECEIEKDFDGTMEKLVFDLKGVKEENEEFLKKAENFLCWGSKEHIESLLEFEREAALSNDILNTLADLYCERVCQRYLDSQKGISKLFGVIKKKTRSI